MGEVVNRIEADVAVIGAGPAGIAAAARAAESGARVVVLDEGLRMGGQIWRHTQRAHLPRIAQRWLDRLDRSGAQVVCGASVVAVTPDLEIAVQFRGAPLSVAARKIVLATGARERFVPFPGWTLPNVTGIGGAQALLKAGASFSQLRVVIAGSGPLLLPVAATLVRGGARLALVAEQASAVQILGFGTTLWRFPGKIVQAAGYRASFARVRYAWGTWVTSATGDSRVQEVTLSNGRRTWTEPCDVLCTGYGLVPSTELARLLGCAVEGGRVLTDAWQRTSLANIYCAGEPTGIGGVEAALVEGQIAGLAASGQTDEAERHLAIRDRYRRFSSKLEAAFMLRDELRSLVRDDTVVCRCEDVRYGRLRSEWSSRQGKLYTRAGMGSCQGRVCGPALEYLFGWTPATVRAPIEPATVATFLNPASLSGGTSEYANEEA